MKHCFPKLKTFLKIEIFFKNEAFFELSNIFFEKQQNFGKSRFELKD